MLAVAAGPRDLLRRAFPRAVKILAFLIILLALTACGGRPESLAPGPIVTLYLPPTAVRPIPTDTPAPTPTQFVTPQPSPTPLCIPNLTFLEDLTIPDGATSGPGEVLDKRWLVKNSGDCSWDEKYRLRLIAGPSLGAVTEQSIFPARSGSEATIRIQFTAPPEAGLYRSAWQAYDPNGIPFGDPFFIEFTVVLP
jgi:hypothetical protein